MKMKQKFYNLVFLRHPEDVSRRVYLFKCPLNIQLFKEQDVSCDTKYGPKNGICETDSFIVDEHSAKQIANIQGAEFPLREITGRATVETRKSYTPFQKV